jgi:hypothetical protein
MAMSCYVLELIPKPDAPIVFDKVIYWVSKEHYLPVKIENYDEFGDLASTINFKDLKEMGGRMIPAGNGNDTCKPQRSENNTHYA